MKTYEEELALEATKKKELLGRVRTQYKKVDAVEAVKLVLDGKTMTYLGKLEGMSEIQLYQVMMQKDNTGIRELDDYRFPVMDERGRFVAEECNLQRLLKREWYQRILTDHETLLELGYDDEQVAKMKDEDVQAEMEQLSVGGME